MAEKYCRDCRKRRPLLQNGVCASCKTPYIYAGGYAMSFERFRTPEEAEEVERRIKIYQKRVSAHLSGKPDDRGKVADTIFPPPAPSEP